MLRTPAKSSAYSRKPDVTSTYRLPAPVHLPDVPSAYDRSLPSVPEASAPSRRTDATRPLVGISLYLVSVGFVGAAIIGICFGTGFFLLASSASDFDRNPPRVYGDAPDSSGEAVLVSSETGVPHSAALAAGLPPRRASGDGRLSAGLSAGSAQNRAAHADCRGAWPAPKPVGLPCSTDARPVPIRHGECWAF